ncbi:MAG: hypothetical protein ACP5VS_14215 [Desulfomonilaceae bacterium]
MKKVILVIIMLIAFGSGITRGDERILNKYGQIQGYIKKDSSGNQQIQNKYGQIKGYIKSDGTITNRFGKIQGYIK